MSRRVVGLEFTPGTTRTVQQAECQARRCITCHRVTDDFTNPLQPFQEAERKRFKELTGSRNLERHRFGGRPKTRKTAWMGQADAQRPASLESGMQPGLTSGRRPRAEIPRRLRRALSRGCPMTGSRVAMAAHKG
jgi:hypothetical protein